MAQSHPQIWPDSPPSSTMMVLSSGDVTACPLKTRKVRQCSFWASVETLVQHGGLIGRGSAPCVDIKG